MKRSIETTAELVSLPQTIPDPDTKVAEPRQRLLLAAEALFARKGFDGATVREICDRAGMNVAAVNYHFGDKERLYVETVRNAHQCSIAEMPAAADGSPAERLRGFIAGMLRGMAAPVRPESMQLLMRELSLPSEATASVVRDFIRPMAMGLEAIILDLLPDMPHRQRLMVGLSVVGQCLYYRQNRTVTTLIFGAPAVEELTLDAVTEHVTRFTFAALGLADGYPTVVRREGAV